MCFAFLSFTVGCYVSYLWCGMRLQHSPELYIQIHNICFHILSNSRLQFQANSFILSTSELARFSICGFDFTSYHHDYMIAGCLISFHCHQNLSYLGFPHCYCQTRVTFLILYVDTPLSSCPREYRCFRNGIYCIIYKCYLYKFFIYPPGQDSARVVRDCDCLQARGDLVRRRLGGA